MYVCMYEFMYVCKYAQRMKNTHGWNSGIAFSLYNVCMYVCAYERRPSSASAASRLFWSIAATGPRWRLVAAVANRMDCK